MKDITTLISQHNIQSDFCREQKLKVRDFVASVFSLFADYRGEFTKEDFFKDQCRLWAKEIIAMPDHEYAMRLDKIKMLVGVPCLQGLHGNYRTPNSALAIACMPLEHINHDYGIAYPRTGSTGALDAIKRKALEYTQEDAEKSKQRISSLKMELFND